jgi:hypothetical protein
MITETTATADRPLRAGDAVLYRFEGRLTGMTPIGVTAEGARIDVTFEADVTEGELGAGTLRGVEYFTLRRDGTGVIDARFAIESAAGPVACHARGYVVPPAGIEAPPLEAVVDPAFPWPDVDLPLVEFATCQTGAPALEHLNRTVAAGHGTVNMATGRLVVETRALVG